MGKMLILEDKYYVYIPSAYYKFSKQEWDDFLKENGGSLEHYRWQNELVDQVRRFRNSR